MPGERQVGGDVLVAVPVDPLVVGAAPRRQVRVHSGLANRVQSGVEVGHVTGVRVEPVERVPDLVGRALEVRGRMDRTGVVQLLEADDRVDLVQVRRAQRRVRHDLAAHGGTAGHQAVLGPPHHQRVGARRRAVSDRGLPGVLALQAFHRQAGTVEQVGRGRLRGGRTVRVAQLHGVRVDDVLRRGSRTPRVVDAAAELHVHRDTGERDAARTDARTVELLQHQQLRCEVTGLRPPHGDRVAGVGVGTGHRQRVGHAVLLVQQVGGQDAVGEDAASLGHVTSGRHRNRGTRAAHLVVVHPLRRDAAGVGKSHALR